MILRDCVFNKNISVDRKMCLIMTSFIGLDLFVVVL